MKLGNWVPLSKSLSQYLLKGKIYSEIEAAFSLQLDLDAENKKVSVAGYAKLWGWSRKRVSSFLEKMGIEIVYQKDTTKIQNQRGQIALQIGSRSGADREQIRLIDSKQLHVLENRPGADREQIGSRSGSTTIDPNTNPKEKINNVRFNARLSLKELGVDEQHITDWFEIRKKKKLPLTRTAFERFKAEAKIINMSIPAAVKMAVEEGWAGFKANWVTNKPKQHEGWK